MDDGREEQEAKAHGRFLRQSPPVPLTPLVFVLSH
jgi:hypothetical protein